ncbi:MAG: hypothetical protein EHM13_11825, partial [Acidobacteria bacterium]
MSARRTLARLRRMGAAEIWFRARAAASSEFAFVLSRAQTPRWRRGHLAKLLKITGPLMEEAIASVRAGDWAAANAALVKNFRAAGRDARAHSDPPWDFGSVRDSVLARNPGAAADAREKAAGAALGRLSLLGYRDLDFRTGSSDGTSAIDWTFDPAHQRRPPQAWRTRIPFLNAECGDHKIIWELNRHQHWLRLGRAAWLTGDPLYATAFRTQLAGWLQQNPPGWGINWASMLELSFRSISWLWTLHMFARLPGTATFEEGDQPWVA